LEVVDNQVGVVVLQHPRERRHAMNTARFLRLGLARAQVHVLPLRGTSSVAPPLDLPPNTDLLYPSPDARDLEGLPVADRPEHLVAIDGTWAQAHRLYRDNPWIAALPCFRLTPTQGSRYRVRVEPSADCLSTVESVIQALRLVEPDLEGTDGVLAAFDRMVEGQIAASAGPSARTRAPRRRRDPVQRVPAGLIAPGARVVVVYAEAAPNDRSLSGQLAPLRVSATALGHDAVFDAMVRTSAAPDAYLCAQMGLTPDDLARAQDEAHVVAALRAFCAADDDSPVVVAGWTGWTLRWVQARLPDLTRVLLKGVWADVSGEKVPSLPDLVADLDLPVSSLSVTGRAGERLALAAAMATHIVGQARGER